MSGEKDPSEGIKGSARAGSVSAGSDGGSQGQQEMWRTSFDSLFTANKGECQGHYHGISSDNIFRRVGIILDTERPCPLESRT